MTRKPDSDREEPVILPGQMIVDVDEDGETVVRETLIPPTEKKPRGYIQGQSALGFSEGTL